MISGPIFLMTVECCTSEMVIRLYVNLSDRRIDTMVGLLIQTTSSGSHNQIFDRCIVMGFLHLRQLSSPFFPGTLLLDLVEIGSEVVCPFMQGGIHFIQICQVTLSHRTGSNMGGTTQYDQLVLDCFPFIGIVIYRNLFCQSAHFRGMNVLIILCQIFFFLDRKIRTVVSVIAELFHHQRLKSPARRDHLTDQRNDVLVRSPRIEVVKLDNQATK